MQAQPERVRTPSEDDVDHAIERYVIRPTATHDVEVEDSDDGQAEITAELRQMEESQKRIYVRSGGGREIFQADGDSWEGEGLPLSSLFGALRNLLDSLDTRVEEIDPEQYSIREIMGEVISMIRRAGPGGMEFAALFPPGESRARVIVMFFALLELIRRNKVKVWQEKSFSTIYIKARQEE